MKKSEIEIGGEYAVYVGSGHWDKRRQPPRNLRRAKVLAFDWIEPEPPQKVQEDSWHYSEWKWRRDHTGTRIKLLTGRSSGTTEGSWWLDQRLAKGGEIAVPNRAIWGRWDAYVQAAAERDAFEVYREEYRQAENNAAGREQQEWTRFLGSLALDEEHRFRFADVGRSWRSSNPTVEEWLVFLRALGVGDHENVEALEAEMKQIAEHRAARLRKAIRERDAKLVDLGIEPDYDDEERELLGLPVEVA